MPPVKNTTLQRKALLAWYRRTARPLPWRSADATPYMVMVSEFMLQQTQAQRVAELLPPFLQRYPTVQILAKASTAEVVRAWKGLGYNNRALRLRNAACAVVEEHNGRIPRDETQLRKLPGFGPYTASAVATFAYGIRTVVLDVNVRRVYSRLMKKRTSNVEVSPDEILSGFALQIMPRSNTDTWYHAVMDLGATVCMARTTKCDACPLQQYCPSRNSIGVSSAKTKRTPTNEPSYKGLPNRIWRGRIVSILREQHAPTSGVAILRGLGITKPKPEDRLWLKELLKGLTKDGIVHGENFQSVILSSS